MLSSTLINIHERTGISWTSLLIISTISLRTIVTLPLAIVQRQRTRRLQNVMKIISVWEKTLKASLSNAPKEASLKIYSSKLSLKTRELYKLQSCHPLKTFLLPWIQIPLFISVSLSIRNLAAYPSYSHTIAPGFNTEGMLWFTDLSVSDPFCVLPVVATSFYLLNLEIQTRKLPDSMRLRVVKFFMRLVSFSMVPIGVYSPSAVGLYWACSAGFSVFQALMFEVYEKRLVKKQLGTEI